MNIYDNVEISGNCKDCKRCETCEKIHRWQLEYLKNVFSNAEKYNSVICSVGYLSFLTILNNFKNELYFWSKISIYIPLSISIFTFIIFEIHKNERINLQVSKLIEAINTWAGLKVSKIIYDSFAKIESEFKEKNLILRNISIISGYISVILFLINIVIYVYYYNVSLL